jgi:lysophospholipase L1-like esterase
MKFKIHEMLEAEIPFRVVAFGSSNTQRYQTGTQWFDYVELGFKNISHKCGQFINSGVSGNTTADLLARFDNELAFYKPHLVILTIGGNDSNPLRNIDAETYRANLSLLHKKITELGSELVFQTYYACDIDRIENKEHVAKMLEYMQIVRDSGKALNCPVVDHYARWDKLRKHDVEIYRYLMRDPMHVNPLGSTVLGLDLLDFFELKLTDVQAQYCREGFVFKSYLDSL